MDHTELCSAGHGQANQCSLTLLSTFWVDFLKVWKRTICFVKFEFSWMFDFLLILGLKLFNRKINWLFSTLEGESDLYDLHMYWVTVRLGRLAGTSQHSSKSKRLVFRTSTQVNKLCHIAKMYQYSTVKVLKVLLKNG